MSDSFIPARPPTPQALLHRLPDKIDSDEGPKLSKYIILIMGSTGVAGKVQIATSVSKALSCPLFQGDSLHESCAKAASLGRTRRPGESAGTGAGADDAASASGQNEARYQRMWLSKLTRTGLLFPDESRPANEGFSGFGGSSSTSTSRRGSASSVESGTSNMTLSTTSSIGSSFMKSGPRSNNPVFTIPEMERLRQANPALMVLTHPQLESWHKLAIRTAVREYGIGIIFVPLYEDEDLPVLKPLDPRTMTSFASFGSLGNTAKAEGRSSEDEIMLRIDIEANVEGITEEVVDGAKDIMRVVE